MKIVKMQLSHVPEVAELEQACFSLPWSRNSLAAELTNPLSCWLVAEENGKVLGYVGAQTACGESDMMNVAVLPESRRRGIALALVSALTEALKEEGSETLTLEVRASNESAIRLYEKLAFRPVGRRPGYYLRPREDALIYRKEL